MSETSFKQDPHAFVPLAALQRDGIVEVVVHGAIVVVHGDDVLFEKGGDFLCYGRSLLKPFQMKVFACDFAKGFSLEAQAISVASHNGESRHLEAAREFLKAFGPPIMESELRTPPSLPLGLAHAAQPTEQTSWNHPCSGKHAAILRGCAMRGWPRDSYLSVDHPYHHEFMNGLRLALGEGWVPVVTAVDGCGLPAPSMTLREMALLFAHLVRTRDEDWIWNAMQSRPEWVGGEGRLDTAIIKQCHGRVLAKEGADGLLGLGVVHPQYPSGLGVLIKIAHGWNPGVASHLAQRVLAEYGFKFTPSPTPHQQTITVYQ